MHIQNMLNAEVQSVVRTTANEQGALGAGSMKESCNLYQYYLFLLCVCLKNRISGDIMFLNSQILLKKSTIDRALVLSYMSGT